MRPLRPVVTTVPGLDLSLPNESRRRAEALSLYDLAVATQCAEGHQDVEDNDLIRSPLRAIRRRFGLRALLAVATSTGLVVAIVLTGERWQLVWPFVFALTWVGAKGWLAAPRALWSAWRHPERQAWSPWGRAAAQRGLDGAVILCLFEPDGTGVWTVPVDRVFRPGAIVETASPLRRGSVPLVRASGVLLVPLDRPRRIDPTVPGETRGALLLALLGPDPAAASARTRLQ